jgi:regulator of protease activity HflC (stomatin/prohibitin superfamily)
MNYFKLAGALAAAVLLILVFLATYFTVEPNEVAVVTHFGKIAYVADPACISRCRSPPATGLSGPTFWKWDRTTA